MNRFAALSLILALGARVQAEPGCEAQATSAKPIALETSMSFPPLASRFNVHGFVVITATIDASGRVIETQIESSEPAGAFDETAKREVAKWRYCADPRGETAPPRHTTMRLRFENAEERVLPVPASCEPGEAWALVKFDLLADGTTANAAIEQACPPGEHDEAVLEEIRSYKYHPDVPAPIVGARELYAIEGEITKQANVSRLSRF